jgi:hypothetical protein
MTVGFHLLAKVTLFFSIENLAHANIQTTTSVTTTSSTSVTTTTGSTPSTSVSSTSCIGACTATYTVTNNLTNVVTGTSGTTLNTNNVSVSSVTSWTLENGTATMGNWIGSWSQLLEVLDNPFGIVFNYPNPTINRATCAVELAYILNLTYPTYISDVVQNSWWTMAHIDQLAASGTVSIQRLLRSSTRQLNTALICTALVCREARQTVQAKGCNQICANGRRMTTEGNIYP